MIAYATKLQGSNCIPFGSIITLTRQSEVDSFPINFPGCDFIGGGLTISGNDIVNLNGLKKIKRVIFLDINNNPNLNNLKGLDSLRYIGDFNVENNNSLLNFEGLNRIDTIFYSNIRNNNALINLIGLDSLVYVRRLGIYFNSNLLHLTGLGNLRNIDDFNVESNNGLLDFIGLNNLDSCNGDFVVTSNNSLQSFIGLDNINYISKLTVYNSPQITNFRGLESLRHLNSFNIRGNANLINFFGLDSITILHQGCFIINNNSLQNFIGLQNVVKFDNYLNIDGNLLITNFYGLEKVQYIGGLSIARNPLLEKFDGFNNLDTIANDFSVYYSNSLINFDGLENLFFLGNSSISIVNNLSLCSINTLCSNLKVIGNQLQSLYIIGNTSLRCCKEVENILNNNIINPNFISIFNNTIGCNDTIEIRTTTNQTCCNKKYTNLKDTICIGDSIFFNSQILKNTGTYYDTFVSNGNDSIVILELKVFNKSYQIKTLNFCIGQSFTLSNGRTITATGIYKDTIPNFCDSIIEYRLNFLNNIIVNQNATICQGKTYTLPKGNSVQTTGVYKDTLRSAFNCDSIVITNLTVTKPIPFVNNVSICKGKNYVLPNGNSVNNTGTYYDTIRKPNTCDSIVITNLIVNPYLQSSQTATTCLGKTYTLLSGKTVTQSGIYKDTIRTITGCDSIVTTNLSITNPTPTQKSDSICEGKIYTLPSGKQVTNTGVYIDTIKITNTCDSVIITNLSVFQNTFSVTLKSIDTIDAGNAIELKPMYSNQPAIIWNWSPSTNLNCTTCEKPIATPSQNTQYSLKATAQNGCDDTAKTTIIIRQTEVYIPTAFSPNNDGINDDLTVFVNNPVAFHLVIFNRYDQKVFESVDVLNKWNGTYKNAECEVDNYVYVLDVTTANGKQHHKQGTITLLR